MDLLKINTIFSSKECVINFGLETTNFLFPAALAAACEFLITCTESSWPQTCWGVVISSTTVGASVAGD